jgi:hypothetical protein
MTPKEAKEYLIELSYKLGNMSMEYLTEKDGERMREAINVLDMYNTIDIDKVEEADE